MTMTIITFSVCLPAESPVTTAFAGTRRLQLVAQGSNLGSTGVMVLLSLLECGMANINDEETERFLKTPLKTIPVAALMC